MAEKTEEKVKCRFCGSENVGLKDKWEEEQYGVDTEGGGVARHYMGTDVKKDYLCKDCGQIFRIFEIKD